MKIARMGDSPEIFHSLQGEGASLGKPAVFLRLAFCNLRCEWCDTSYTWKWTPREMLRHTITISPKEVAACIADFPSTHVVVTGGEPLLQDKKLVELMSFLPRHTFEIETNGTIIPSPELDVRVVQYNVSPKLKHSGNSGKDALPEDSLKWFASSPKSWFKFVVSSAEDIDDIARLEERFSLPHDRILLMPLGTTQEELEQSLPWLADECIKRNYRLTDRLHIRLWGNKPGT